MRRIKEIIIHCSATIEGRDYTAKDIDSWHRAQGFNAIGYHYVIRLDGTVETGRPLWMVGAHCKGHNLHSIGICYIGGLALAQAPTHAAGMPPKTITVPKDTRTPQQRKALSLLIKQLRDTYREAQVYCHNQFANKACPSFKIDQL